MSSVPDNLQHWKHEGVAVDVAVGIEALFACCSTLCGFSVQERGALGRDRHWVPLDEDLCIADVSVYYLSGLDASLRVYEQITLALHELLDEYPEARELLRGQSFARVFH